MTSAARSWKPYPTYKDSGREWLGKVPSLEYRINNLQINSFLITQKLYYHSLGASQKPMQPKAHTIAQMLIWEMKNKPRMNANERRLVKLTHRKGREERKAAPQKSLRHGIVNTPRCRTRMTRIKRIFMDNSIRAHQRHPCNPCSIGFTSHCKSSNQRYFPAIAQQEAAC